MSSSPVLRKILLASDAQSPNAGPHGLPALLWRGLFLWLIEGSGSPESNVKRHLQGRGWDPQWVFPMYKEAHYHSTTHELLSIIRGSATLLLGGTDADVDATNISNDDDAESAEGSSSAAASRVAISVREGDVLLLPAGYSHRAIVDAGSFTMVGSYPRGSTHWDNRQVCRKSATDIERLVQTVPRKGLGKYALDPSVESGQAGSKTMQGRASSLEAAWSLARQ